MTNSIAIQQAVNALGYHLSGDQIAAIIGGAFAVSRWLHLEYTIATRWWSRVGGWAGIKQFWATGKSTEPKQQSPAA